MHGVHSFTGHKSVLQSSPGEDWSFFPWKNSNLEWCGRVELPWKAMLESISGTYVFEVGSFQCVPGESCGRWQAGFYAGQVARPDGEASMPGRDMARSVSKPPRWAS